MQSLQSEIVSEHPSAMEELRASEERFQLLSRATNDAIWDWNLLTDSLWWNEGFFSLFGYTRQGTPAHISSWRDRIVTDDRARVVAKLEAALASGAESWWDEYRFQKADGSQAFVLDRGHIIRDDRGTAIRMIGGMTDLTSRREADEQLAAQAALLNEARDAILLTDLDGHVLFWNRGAERVYGWSAGDAVGRNVLTLFQGDSPEWREATARLGADGKWEGTLEHRSRSGSLLQVDTRIALTRDLAGEPKAVLTLSTDVTERRKYEAHQLRAQRMESIGTLAGGIAHDLNNLLAPMMMAVDLLRHTCTDGESVELLNTLQASASRGASLVQQVLSFARGVEGQRVPVSPILVVREVQRIMRDSFPKSIAVEVLPATDIWSVQGDPTQLHQVLLNLCVNARDAMPAGGRLSIAVENGNVDEVFVAQNPDGRLGDYVIVRITDSGSGISDTVRERIFEPFFSTKAIGQGTGLGLSTSLAIVRSHGGFMSLYTEPGVGTTFRVYLPADRAGRAAVTTPVHVPAILSGNGELLLVVDDESPIRRIAQRTLERAGYRVLTAADGVEALAVYTEQAGTVDAVITDMAMPGMDGPSLIRALRTLNPAVLVITSSGLATDENDPRSAGLGCAGFVPKPYTANMLLGVVHDALTRRAVQ